MRILIKALLFIIFLSIVSFAANKKIVIDLYRQMAYAYEGKRLVYQGWISSGRKEYRTPTGVFRILEKDKEHISNEWPKKKSSSMEEGGAPMPYMLRLTWSGIALHAGYTPNYPASHGCIRLQESFAKKLFYWARVGTKVIIKGKAPRKVKRVGKGFIDYIAIAKNKKYKKVKISKKKVYYAKKLSKRDKYINYYAKFSYKKLNRILRKSYRKKRLILKSKKIKRYAKIRELRKIKWLVNILKEAKYKKYLKRVKKGKSLCRKKIC